MNWQWLLNDILKLFKWYSNERKAVGSGHVRKDRAHRFFVRVVFVLFETRRFCKVERFVFPDLSNIVRKRILFFPGKAFSQMLGNMSVTKMVVPDTDYTDGSSNGGGDNSNPSGGNDGDQGENPLG